MVSSESDAKTGTLSRQRSSSLCVSAVTVCRTASSSSSSSRCEELQPIEGAFSVRQNVVVRLYCRRRVRIQMIHGFTSHERVQEPLLRSQFSAGSLAKKQRQTRNETNQSENTVPAAPDAGARHRRRRHPPLVDGSYGHPSRHSNQYPSIKRPYQSACLCPQSCVMGSA